MDESIIDMMLSQVGAGDPGATRVIKAELERLRGIEARLRTAIGGANCYSEFGEADLRYVLDGE